MIQYILQKLDPDEAQSQLQSCLIAHPLLLNHSQWEKMKKYQRECRLIKAAMNYPLDLKQLVYQAPEMQYEQRNSAPWLSLPPPLWIGIGIFLEEKDLLHLFQTRFSFAFDLLQRILYSRQERIRLPFPVYEITDFCRTLYHTYARFHHRWYTLFDYDYIQLFRLVEQRDFVLAQEFIRSRQHHPDLIDMIFYQKDGNGKTVITLADELNFQIFLDYCFKTFALSPTGNRPYSLVKLGNYSAALSRLDAGIMSDEIFWIFACAYICNQWDVWNALRNHPHWDINAFTSQGKQSIISVAVMLGSIALFDFVFSKFKENLTSSRYFKPFELYVNQKGIHLDLKGIIGISKNRELIDRINDFDNEEKQHDLELLFFYIENKDLNKLQECYRDIQIKGNYYMESYNTISWLSNTFFRIQSQLPLTPLGFAIVKDWMAGVQCILNYNPGILNQKLQSIPSPLSIAVKFNRIEIIKYLLNQGASPNNEFEGHYQPPIFDAIDNNNLEIIKLLVEHGACLQGIFLADSFLEIKYTPTPLLAAIAINYFNGVQRMVERRAVSLNKEVDELGHPLPNPLSLAVYLGLNRIVEYLLSKGAKPDGFEDKRCKQPAPIFYAVKQNNLELVELLIKHGSDSYIENRQNTLHRYPLVSAILYKHSEIIACLIKHIGLAAAVEQVREMSDSQLVSNEERELLRKAYNDLSNNYYQMFNSHLNKKNINGANSLMLTRIFHQPATAEAKKHESSNFFPKNSWLHRSDYAPAYFL